MLIISASSNRLPAFACCSRSQVCRVKASTCSVSLSLGIRTGSRAICLASLSVHQFCSKSCHWMNYNQDTRSWK